MITFNRLVNFTGRNGYLKQGGIGVDKIDDIIGIFPVTSKGLIARCDIQIPVENIDEFIEQLQKLKNQL